MIRHFVLSGGGVWGLSCYGALRESHRDGLWVIDNIQSIFATSVGSILAIILCLRYDWNDIDDYLIKRPWKEVFSFDFGKIIDAVVKRGLFDRTVIDKIFTSLLEGKDLSVNITLEEFCLWCKIDLHIFSCEINGETIHPIEFCKETHGKWKLLDVIYCSCCVPVLFQPFLTESGECYIDGAICNNYPLEECLKRGCPENEIFGIRKTKKTNIDYLKKVGASSNLFDYLIYLLNQIMNKELFTPHQIKNQLDISSEFITIYEVMNASRSSEERMRLIAKGEEAYKNSKIGLSLSPT
jgi:predicted acylesterase/phospholipase RssA